MIKRAINIVILIIITHFVNGQNIYFQHITSSDGLSHSEVYSFLEDSRGFMWFGTLYGLNMYDGYNIKKFNTDRNNPHSITNNTIRSISEDYLGRVWIGTDDGLNVYDPILDKIFKVNLPGYQNRRLIVHSILCDGKNLMISTSDGLLKSNINASNFDEIGENFIRLHNSEYYKKGISLIKKGDNGMIWVSNGEFLLSLVFVKDREEPVIVNQQIDEQLIGVRDMTFDYLGNLWLATFDNGLLRYNIKENVFDRFYENQPNPSITTSKTSSVISDAKGNLWIGTRDKGLLFLPKDQLNKKNPVFTSVQHDPFNKRGLNSNLIFSLYVSKRNMLWVGTVGSGINMYDPHQKKFNYYSIPPKMDASQSGSNFIRSVYSGNNDKVFIGTHTDGLYLFDRKNDTFKKIGYGTQSIFYLEKLSENELIVCSSSGVTTAQILDGNRLKIKESPIKQSSFYAVKGAGDVIWVASLSGVYKCKLHNGRLIVENSWDTNTNPSISFNNCRVLYYSKENNDLFVGTEGGGLNILELDAENDVKNVTVYQKNTSQNSLSNNFIRSILEDSDQNIWIGTYEGLNKVIDYNNPYSLSFIKYTTDNGLPNNMIQLLVEDKNKNIWIGTNNGLCVFKENTNEFLNFSKSDGLQSNEFSEHSVYKKPDGEVIIGGTNGFNIFYPENITVSNYSPTTTITEFYLFNRKVDIKDDNNFNSPLNKGISFTDSLFLSPNQTSLGFEFSSLIYSYPEKVQYSYKLEGFDENWNFTNANNRLANYTNLEYGEYVFKVRSTNGDGLWEESTKDIYILIETPFYLTIHAYIIYGLVFVFVIIYFTNYTAIKYTTKKKILLESEHNKQLHELDELRTKFFINVSHDLRTPLTLISGPLKSVLKDNNLKIETRKKLELAQRNVKKLRYISEQLLDIRKAEAGKLVFEPENNDFIMFIKMEVSHFTDAIKSKGLRMNVITDHDSILCRFDSNMISKILFNLLSNAIKYTNEGEINLRIDLVSSKVDEKLESSKHSNFIKLEIQDSGKGIPFSELDKIFDRFYHGKNKDVGGYGIGLSHCKDLVEAHEGIIEAISSQGTGTTFKILIPQINQTQFEESEKSSPHTTPDVYIDTREDLSATIERLNITPTQKILIIEDNMDMRGFLKSELKKYYKIIEAGDGIEGLAMAEKYAPDLILSDIMMPNMDGIEFCNKLKSDIKTSHIPLILLTAKGDIDTKYKSIEIGADDYIPKPFEIDYLIIRIKNLLNAKEIQRNAFQMAVDLIPSSVETISIDNKFLSEMISVIEVGMSDPDFTVNTLESKMGMSHTNFYRKVKHLTGKSGKEILMDMRMKRARQILQDSNGVRISEVAYNVGFTNPKYFSKCFKEYYGVLPSDLMINE